MKLIKRGKALFFNAMIVEQYVQAKFIRDKDFNCR